MAHSFDVVITGIGLTTPLGSTTQETWRNLLEGVRPFFLFNPPETRDVEPFVIGAVPSSCQPQLDAAFHPSKQRKTERFIHLAVLAGYQAMADAGLSATTPLDRSRFGAIVGVGIGGLQVIGDGEILMRERGAKAVSPFLIPRTIANEAPGWLGMEFDLRGPTFALTNACASGTDAIGMALRLIRHGYVDCMLAGGAESCTTPLALAAFRNMRALVRWEGNPAEASRPFDRDHHGFVMGEGAGIVVLERKDLALKRGAKIYAELVGFGCSADAYHITAMHPEGRGAVAAMQQALADANIAPTDIDYINAHGTSTSMNDAIEAQALHAVFGDHVRKTSARHALVSATKSMTGHLLGAGGGVEAAITALSLFHQIVPPTMNLENPIPEAEALDLVPGSAREAHLRYAQSNSFGFGGGNSVLILKINQV